MLSLVKTIENVLISNTCKEVSHFKYSRIEVFEDHLS